MLCARGCRQLPDPPEPVGPGADSTVWRWDGVNGNNAVWLGSTKAGLRVSLKGDDPDWQAGVPHDSRASPDPPPSWSNSGAGGIAVHRGGTVTAFSGGRSLDDGATISCANLGLGGIGIQ